MSATADRDRESLAELTSLSAVPMMVPRRQSARDASASILADCAPRLLLTTTELAEGARGDVLGRFREAGLDWLAIDAEPGEVAGTPLLERRPNDIAFLQY